MVESYPEFFRRVTGCNILPYQERYGENPFSSALVTVPTGLGKTDTVLLPWLYAQASGDSAAPTRLVIVLSRQNLTAQAAANAKKRVAAAGLADRVKILELMAGSGDNRETLRPYEPAIVVCTQASAAAGLDGDLVRVACPVPASEHRGRGTWMDGLTFSTANLLKERASSPLLLRQIHYIREESAIETDPPRQLRRKPQGIQTVVLGLDATVLPLVTSTIEVSEQIRVRLMGSHKRRMGSESAVSPLFSGETPQGEKRLDPGHVYILPLGNAQGRIDRVLIVSPLRPFSDDELDAVRGVRELYQPDGRGAAQCVVTWQGPLNSSREYLRTGTVESATPFVPPRHWHPRSSFDQFLVDEVRRECTNHRVGAPTEVSILERMPGAGLFHEVEYRRNRKNDPVRPGDVLRLRFTDPVAAPFSIGYGAPFGLGQFHAAQNRTE